MRKEFCESMACKTVVFLYLRVVFFFAYLSCPRSKPQVFDTRRGAVVCVYFVLHLYLPGSVWTCRQKPCEEQMEVSPLEIVQLV